MISSDCILKRVVNGGDVNGGYPNLGDVCKIRYMIKHEGVVWDTSAINRNSDETIDIVIGGNNVIKVLEDVIKTMYCEEHAIVTLSGCYVKEFSHLLFSQLELDIELVAVSRDLSCVLDSSMSITNILKKSKEFKSLGNELLERDPNEALNVYFKGIHLLSNLYNLEDNERINVKLMIFYLLSNSSAACIRLNDGLKAIQLASKAFDVAEKFLPYKKELKAKALFRMGQAHEISGAYSLAHKSYRKSASMFNTKSTVEALKNVKNFMSNQSLPA